MDKKPGNNLERIAVRSTRWIGSTQSIVLHTIIFVGSFSLYFFGIEFDKILLVLTTIVSLEAIYLSIFIQMSVNRQQIQLEEVSEDIEDIQEDVEEIQKGVDEIEKDIDDIQENVEDIQEGVEEIEKDIDEIQEDVEGIEKDIDTIQEDVEEIQGEEIEESVNPPLPIQKTEAEIVLLLRNLDKKIADLQKEIQSSQQEKADLRPKAESLKQKVVKLLKK